MSKIGQKISKLSFRQSGFLILCGFAIVLLTLFLSLFVAENHMVKNLLREKMELVDHKMNVFFTTVEEAFVISYKRGRLQEYEDRDIKELNRKFIPVLEGFKAISAVDLADDRGNCYLLKHSKGLWVNIITQVDFKYNIRQRFVWENNTGGIKLLENDSLADLYDPRLRPWYKGALKTDEETVYWTKPYVFKPSGIQGITVSKKWEDSSGTAHVLSFDVALLDISKFTTQLEISPRGKTFIMTADGRCLGLPKDDRYQDYKELEAYLLLDADSLGIPEISAAKRQVINSKIKSGLHSFNFSGEKYFLHTQSFPLGVNKFRICILIPECDLMDDFMTIRWIVLLALISIALMAIAMVEAYLSKNKANQLLFVQKQELEQKNLAISDSIHYAKHLQEAILPSCVMMRRLFPESFILFKPKDIVSGDFYWKHSFEGMVYFAVADCTGHGIPGAMVSVVCTNALNRVIKEYGIIEPGKILDNVREQVVDAFSQSEDEVSDGMDIALCCIDLDMNKLWYSGANNSLYRISRMDEGTTIPKKCMAEGNRMLIEYSATRQPIGKYTQVKNFETREITLEPGDCLYLFSDGFSDQFGGPKGKKYMSKPFKRYLLSIYDEPMEQQGTLLTSEFENWKGELEQVDDVCVVGIRI